eukprot:GDKI01005268.1.p1 GENE.GDKI01005268.1~~GDKI01005268.1.p1  ORF type:complete len:481 (+),score=106.72 GDKI01005268.1:117-1559(+)
MEALNATIKHAPRELWICYLIQFLDSWAAFSLDYVFVKFLTDEVGFSDQATGLIYGLFGIAVLMVGVSLGFVIDNLGVRRCLSIGSAMLALSYLAVCLLHSSKWMLAVLLIALPISNTLVNPVTKLALRRFTVSSNRTFGFGISYVVINLAALLSGVFLTGVRTWTNGHASEAHGWSHYRIYILFAVLACTIQCGAAFFLRDIRVQDDNTIEEYKPKGGAPYDILTDVLQQKRFWRFVGAALVVSLGVGTVMRHLGATFPKYFTREFGNDAPYELVMSINPLMVVVLVPLVTYYESFTHIPLYPAMMFGSAISGLAMFFLAASTTMTAAVLAVIVFTVGEAIWSPRFLEYSVMVAPEGREGTYVVLSSAPKYVSRCAAGLISGYLLAAFAPETGVRHSQALWAIIGMMAMMTPIAFYFWPSLIAVQNGSKDELNSSGLDASSDPEKAERAALLSNNKGDNSPLSTTTAPDSGVPRARASV